MRVAELLIADVLIEVPEVELVNIQKVLFYKYFEPLEVARQASPYLFFLLDLRMDVHIQALPLQRGVLDQIDGPAADQHQHAVLVGFLLLVWVGAEEGAHGAAGLDLGGVIVGSRGRLIAGFVRKEALFLPLDFILHHADEKKL